MEHVKKDCESSGDCVKNEDFNIKRNNMYVPCTENFFPLPYHSNTTSANVTNSLENISLPGISYWDKTYKDIVVLPSLSFDAEELEKITGISHYEERSLFNLILLRHPDTRVIYITSQPLDSSIVEYYWKLLPGDVPFCQIRNRLLLLSTYDSSPKPLSEKVLERPRLIERIRSSLRDPSTACLTCFKSSHYESLLAKLLGIRLLAVDVGGLWWGTKAGSRQIFKACNILTPPGIDESITNVDILARNMAKTFVANPHSSSFVVKLNDGFSGCGNAILDMTQITKLAPTIFSCLQHPEELFAQLIRNHLPNLRFQSHNETWESFLRKIQTIGCIAEIYLENAIASPSVQACVDTNGEVILLSTHEQVLAGIDKQTYQGCSFPASIEYRLQIQEYARRVGVMLAEKGVIDHFGVDFVVVPGIPDSEGTPSFGIYAIEINLRQGGTTHPMMTLKLLTGGQYDENTGTFRTPKGNEKYYVASDNVCYPEFKGLLPHDIMENFQESHLHFNHETEKGVVFHLLGALSQYGKIGITAISDSPTEAALLFDQAVEQLKSIGNETQLDKEEIFKNFQNIIYQPPTPSIELPTI